ncbi:MAG: hypothetical protein WD648_10110 [Planctomycetaceae bacterium]
MNHLAGRLEPAFDMASFEDLAASRREWIASVLKPWCQAAPLVELRKAEQEWQDIAGRIDTDSTLWTWAWSRFPNLVHEGLSGVDETHEVRITLSGGSTFTGYPDARKSQKGWLVLVATGGGSSGEELGPYSIDEILEVERIG